MAFDRERNLMAKYRVHPGDGAKKENEMKVFVTRGAGFIGFAVIRNVINDR